MASGDRVLLRCFKNFRTAFADGDPETLYNAEFCDRLGSPDLHVSVYEVDASQWLDAFMCHRAAAGTDPPRIAQAVDVAPLVRRSTPARVEDGSLFDDYLSAYHHEVDFEDEADLRAFVTALASSLTDKRARLFKAEKAELKQWLKDRRKAGDPLWLGFLGSSERWASWAPASDSVPPPAG